MVLRTTGRDHPVPQAGTELLHDLFRAQARRTPDAIALVDGSVSETYRSLDEETEVLAALLRARGMRAGDRVGVLMGTSAGYAKACIAVLKAGAAFVPLSPHNPPELLADILDAAQTTMAITTERDRHLLPVALRDHCLLLHDDTLQRRQDERLADAGISTEDVAFVPFTSGTTGAPKGVMQTHRAAVSSYLARYTFSSYQVGDRVGCNIFFVWEFLRPLLRGGTCYVIPDDVIRLPRLLLSYIAEHAITEVLLTSSLLRSVLRSADMDTLRSSLRSLRVLWVNGEVLPTGLAQEAMVVLSEGARLFNTYSISECHDVATIDLTQASLEDRDVCPVGYAMEGVVVRVLPDRSDHLACEGTGELYVGGAGLALGYLGAPAAARRFCVIDGERYYATGDRGSIEEDGLITVAGRCDSVVKVRGYSVDLQGIEEALCTHCAIREAVVSVEGSDDAKRLVAWVVREPGAAWEVDHRSGLSRDLQGQLSRYLPPHLVPSRYVELGTLPVDSRTGKLDRAALLAAGSRLPPSTAEPPAIPSPGDVSPADRLAAVREIWSRVLELDADDIDDDRSFFDLGGDSLSGLEVILEMERVFGIELRGDEVFNYPTIRQLADHLDGGPAGEVGPTDLRADAVLNSLTIPVDGDACRRLPDATSILLTGATGFLGAFLLDELLRSTPERARVYCLLRSDTTGPEGALERLRETLHSYGLPGVAMLHRVIPVVGDLSQPGFGLNERAYRKLAEEVDLIFHCAAAVNYVYPYPALKRHTVDGTREMLRFACLQRLKPLQYVSSNGVFPGGDWGPYLEDRHIERYADRLAGGYNQAKWVAEMLVWAAADRGLPVCVYRPGNIGHHRVTGAANPHDFQTMLLRACACVGCAPLAPDWNIEMTPVDFLVTAIRRFAEEGDHWGNVYHAVQTPPLRADEVFEHLEHKGRVRKRVPVEEWKTLVARSGAEKGEDWLRVLAHSLDFITGYLTDVSVYDGTRFNQALARAGLRRPTVDPDYMLKVLAQEGEGVEDLVP